MTAFSWLGTILLCFGVGSGQGCADLTTNQIALKGGNKEFKNSFWFDRSDVETCCIRSTDAMTEDETLDVVALAICEITRGI